MTAAELIARLEALKRYEAYVDNGCCEMCGTTVSMEEEPDGVYVRHDDIDTLIKELKNGN